MQKHTPVVAPKTQAPKAPVAPSAPQPIDPQLLRHVSGGGDAGMPTKGW